MGAPLGNQNAAKQNRRWQDAITRALARHKAGDLTAGLDAAADKLVRLAIERGDKWAIDHIADRLDGKPKQSTDLTVDAGSNLIDLLAGIGKSDDSTVA